MNSTEIMADLSSHTPMMQQYLKVKRLSTCVAVLSYGRLL